MSFLSSLFNPQILIYLVAALLFSSTLGLDVTSLLGGLGTIIPGA